MLDASLGLGLPYTRRVARGLRQVLNFIVERHARETQWCSTVCAAGPVVAACGLLLLYQSCDASAAAFYVAAAAVLLPSLRTLAPATWAARPSHDTARSAEPVYDPARAVSQRPASVGDAQAPPEPLDEPGALRLLRSRLAERRRARVEALRAARASRGVPLYASEVRHTVVSVKLSEAAPPLPPPHTVMAAVPPQEGAVRRAVVQAAAHAAQRASQLATPHHAPLVEPPQQRQRVAEHAPVLVSYVGFAGCYHALSFLSDTPPDLTARHVSDALSPLLPPSSRILHVGLTSARQAAAAAAGCFCEPVALRSGEAAPQHVWLSLSLPWLAKLEAAGRGLRVVVSETERSAAVADVTLRPGEAGWPASGELQLRLAAGAGPLLAVSLLSTCAPPAAAGQRDAAGDAAPAPPPAHGADAFVTALPLLVLPAAAAREVNDLWCDMVCDEVPPASQDDGAALRAAAGALFGARLAPLALDLASALLRRREGGGGGGAARVRAAILDFLQDNGMYACLELVVKVQLPGSSESCGHSSGVPSCDADGAKAAARAAACAALRPCIAARGAPLLTPLLGFAESGEERAYQVWRAASLAQHDAATLAIDVFRVSLFCAVVVWAAMHRGGSAIATAALQLAHAAVSLAPSAWLVARTRGVSPHRAALLCASVWHFGLTSMAAMCAARAAGWDMSVYAVLVARPVMFLVFCYVLQPALQQLGPLHQGIASAGNVLSAHVLYAVLDRPPPLALLALFWGVSVAIAGGLDLRARRQWAGERKRGGGGGGGGGTAHSAGARAT